MNYLNETMRTANRVLSHKPKTTEGMNVNRSQALKFSHNASKLKQLLETKDEVNFTYVKDTGEVRTARGRDFFKAKDNPYLIVYWDIDKNNFRSCRIDRIIDNGSTN